jgi:hypothetical protein
VALVVAVIAILVCGCGLKNDITTVKADDKDIAQELISIIEGSEQQSEYTTNISIKDEDRIFGVDNTQVKRYISYNAIYIQIDKYMYRFQRDLSGNIVSYIKYQIGDR